MVVVVAIIHSGDGGASDGGSSCREEEMGLSAADWQLGVGQIAWYGSVGGRGT